MLCELTNPLLLNRLSFEIFVMIISDVADAQIEIIRYLEQAWVL